VAGDTTLKVTILGDADSLEKAFKQGGTSAETFGDKLKTVATAAAGAFAAYKVADFITGSISAASDLNETVSKVAQVYGNARDAAQVYAQELSTANENAEKATGKYQAAVEKSEARIQEIRADGAAKHAELADKVKDAETRQADAVVSAADVKEQAQQRYDDATQRAKDNVLAAEAKLEDVARSTAEKVEDAKENLADVVEQTSERIKDAEASAAERVENAQDRQARAHESAVEKREAAATRLKEAEADLAKAQEEGAKPERIEALTKRVNDARENQEKVATRTAKDIERADKDAAKASEDAGKQVERVKKDAARATEDAKDRVEKAEADGVKATQAAEAGVRKAKDAEKTTRERAADDLERAEKRAEKILTDAAGAVEKARAAMAKQAADQAEAEGKAGAAVEGYRTKMVAAKNDVVRVQGEIDAANMKMSRTSKAEIDKVLKDLDGWSSGAAKHFGLSKKEALDGAASMAMFGKAAGLQGPELAEFSKKLVVLSGDLGSFHNADPAEVVQAMGAALRGEAEPMRKFGVDLNSIKLETEAMNMKIWDGHGALTQQQKILAANSIIFKDTADAQGDYNRTSEGLANKTRTANKEFADMQAEIGQKLLPVQLALTNAFVKALPTLKDIGEKIADVVVPAFKLLVDVGKTIYDWVKDNWPYLTGVILGFAASMAIIYVPGMIASATATWALVTAWIAANAQAILIGAAIAALVAGVIYAYEHWGWFRDAVDAVWQFMQNTLWPMLQTVGEYIGNAFVAAIGFLSDAWNNVLQPALKDAWKFISETLWPILEKVGKWFGEVIVTAFGLMKTAWDTVLYPTLKAIWDYLKDPVFPFLEKVGGWFATTIVAAFGALKTAWDEVLSPALHAIWGFITDPLLPLLGKLAEWFITGIKAAWKVMETAWNEVLSPVLTALWKFVDKTLMPILGTLAGWFDTAIGVALDVAKGVFDTVMGAIELAIKPVTTAVGLVGSGLGLIPNLVESLKEPFERIFGLIWNAIKLPYEAMKWIIENGGKVAGFITGAGEVLTGGAGQPTAAGGAPVSFRGGKWYYGASTIEVPQSDMTPAMRASLTAGGAVGGAAPTNSQGGPGQTFAQMVASGMTVAQIAEQTGLDPAVIQANLTMQGAGSAVQDIVGAISGGDFPDENDGDPAGSGPGEANLTANAVALRRKVVSTFDYTNIGGYAFRTTAAGTPSDHAKGKALDVGSPASPIPHGLGDRIAAWAIGQSLANYVIWDNQIWSRQHPSWRDYATSGSVGRANQGSPTGRHEDHVHISVLGRGGIMRARRGGRLGLLAEAGHDEAVIPLDGASAHAKKFASMVADSIAPSAGYVETRAGVYNAPVATVGPGPVWTAPGVAAEVGPISPELAADVQKALVRGADPGIINGYVSAGMWNAVAAYIRPFLPAPSAGAAAPASGMSSSPSAGDPVWDDIEWALMSGRGDPAVISRYRLDNDWNGLRQYLSRLRGPATVSESSPPTLADNLGSSDPTTAKAAAILQGQATTDPATAAKAAAILANQRGEAAPASLPPININVNVEGTIVQERNLVASIRDVVTDPVTLMALRDGLLEFSSQGITLGLG